MSTFDDQVKQLFAKHEALITRKNEPMAGGNGVYTRYKYPVVTVTKHWYDEESKHRQVDSWEGTVERV